jgi:hypothetical protein
VDAEVARDGRALVIREPALKDLKAARDLLERYGDLVGAEMAQRLSEAAEALSKAAVHLGAASRKEWLIAEEAAVHMGYVERKTGEPETQRFMAAMRAAGVPRRKLNGTTVYFKRSELDAFLDALPRA